MSNSKVVHLGAYRNLKLALKQAKELDPTYELKIAKMDKLELLNEMVQFQEDRAKIGKLTLPLMVRGKILFSALEKSSETRALKTLTRSYRKHLELELQAYLDNQDGHNRVGAVETDDSELA